MVRARLWLAVTVVYILVLLLGACTPAVSPSSTPSPTTPQASGEQAEPVPATVENGMSDNPSEPILSNALIRGCEPSRQPSGGFETAGLREGEKAINFTLKDIHGNEFVLSRLLAEKPVVMVFGSFT